MRLAKQLAVIFVTLAILGGGILIFSYDVIRFEWTSFMEQQASFRAQEQPLPVPALSIPVDGPAFIPNLGAPTNPVPPDEVSIARGENLFAINCVMCHGITGEGNGQIAALLENQPANLTQDIVQSKSDGSLFLTLTNGVTDRMPPMIENLTVRDRWDVVNYLRTLHSAQ